MNYNSQDFIEDCPKIPLSKALYILDSHGADLTEFLTDNKADDLFESSKLLAWLGY